MKIATRAGLIVRLGMTAAVVLLSQQALAVGTDAGVTVSNQASVDYFVGGVDQADIESSPTGNSVPGAGGPTDFLVDRRVDFEVTQDNTTDVVTPGTNGHTFDFTLTNESNSTMDYQVTLTQLVPGDIVNGLDDTNVDVANAVISTTYVDDLGEDANIVITVTGDAAATLVNGDVANIRVTVVGFDPAGNAGTPVALVDGAGNADNQAAVDNVFADPGNDNSEVGEDGIQVVSAALAITKTLDVLSDPFGGVTPNAKAVPDALIEYTLTIDNTGGSATAETITVTDNIQIPAVLFEDEAYGALDDLRIDGVARDCDATDTSGDGCTYDPGTGLLSFTVPNIANGATTIITYQVRVNTL